MYPFRPGMEQDRLQLIWEVYNWIGSQASGSSIHDMQLHYNEWNKNLGNKNREHSISWDLCQIFGAIAGGYVIELSPHYKGVQRIRKNKELWTRVNKFVKLKTGTGCLPYDPGITGEKWEQINDIHFFQGGE